MKQQLGYKQGTETRNRNKEQKQGTETRNRNKEQKQGTETRNRNKEQKQGTETRNRNKEQKQGTEISQHRQQLRELELQVHVLRNLSEEASMTNSTCDNERYYAKSRPSQLTLRIGGSRFNVMLGHSN